MIRLRGWMTQKDTIRNEGILAPSVQVAIMLLLYTHEKAQFTTLQKLLGLTPGNLNHHLNRLEQAGFVERSKRLFSARPSTVLSITSKGKNAFRRYISHFKKVLG
jgi:DNA-binding MarR family transcriptional regulator